MLVSDEAPRGFEPGDHASTYGGNPVACAAACAVVDEITDELLAGVRAKEALVRERFPAARGRGLLLAFDVERAAGEIASVCCKAGLLVGTAGPHTIRLSPPLTISEDDLAHGLGVLEEVLAA